MCIRDSYNTEPPKKSRKRYLRKANEMAGHSSKYQKDYQKYTHEPVKTHRYTSTQHIQNTHSSTEQHSNLYIRVHRSTAQHTSTQVWHTIATKATALVTVTPGGHSVRHTEVVPTFDTELTNHSYGGAHGSEPVSYTHLTLPTSDLV